MSNLNRVIHGTTLVLPDAELIFYPAFFKKTESDEFYEELIRHTHWKQEKIKLYGKRINLPCLTDWIGDKDASYTYSGIKVTPEPWTLVLLKIKKRIETISPAAFNSVLLNLYRNERDSVSWHSDDEKEFGQNPVIGSVSFGDTRRFQLKHKQKKKLRYEIHLTHGSYLLMKGQTQHFWLHQIPKENKPKQERINLTFRKHNQR